MRGLTTALAMVGAGHGLTAAPSYARIFADIFGVTFLPLPAPAGERGYYLYTRQKHDLSPAARTFVDLARAEWQH